MKPDPDAASPSTGRLPLVHAEVVQADSSTAARQDLARLLESHAARLAASDPPKLLDELLRLPGAAPDPIGKHVESVQLVWDENQASAGGGGGDAAADAKKVRLDRCRVRFHVFKLDRTGGQAEEMEPDGDEGAGAAGINAATHWILPSLELQGSWESLVYDSDVKPSLLNFVRTTLRLARLGVDKNLISWNSVVLLHGPPGTGKTSLCRALAQKLAIRLSHRYRYGQLIEVNSHSLFSKWFSESGKLVQRMFDAIQDLVDDPTAFVCVLIDEVESLAAVRRSSGAEPSDAVRVVNALLTQLDKLKQHPNVLLLTTSNLTGSVDLAFVDRADIKKYLGMPSEAAVYTMLRGSVEDLMSKGFISISRRTFSYLVAHEKLKKLKLEEDQCNGGDHAMSNGSSSQGSDEFCSASSRLLDIARECKGFSGRTIRKLPFLAAVKLEDDLDDEADGADEGAPMERFLDCLAEAVREQKADREKLA